MLIIFLDSTYSQNSGAQKWKIELDAAMSVD